MTAKMTVDVTAEPDMEVFVAYVDFQGTQHGNVVVEEGKKRAVIEFDPELDDEDEGRLVVGFWGPIKNATIKVGRS